MTTEPDHVNRWIASLSETDARMIVDQAVRALYLNQGRYDLEKPLKPETFDGLAEFLCNMGTFTSAMARQQDEQERANDFDAVADALIEADWLINHAGGATPEVARDTASRNSLKIIEDGCSAFSDLKATIKAEREANRQQWQTMVEQLREWAKYLNGLGHAGALRGTIAGMTDVANDIKTTRT